MSKKYELWGLKWGLRIFESKDRYASKVHEEIIRRANMGRSYTVLDIGCGTGFLTFEAAKYAEQVIALDLSRPLLRYVIEKAENPQRNILPIRCDAVDLSFKDESFDAVLAGWILHELPDRLETLKEWVRVLKKGAPLVVGDKGVPEDRSLFDFKLSDNDFFVEYSVRKEHFDGNYLDAQEQGFNLDEVSLLFKEAGLCRINIIPWRRFYFICVGIKRR